MTPPQKKMYCYKTMEGAKDPHRAVAPVKKNYIRCKKGERNDDRMDK
jgi:hypothetical protein